MRLRESVRPPQDRSPEIAFGHQRVVRKIEALKTHVFVYLY